MDSITRHDLRTMRKKKLTPEVVLFSLVVFALFIGLLTIGDYGEGWDNVWMYQYGVKSLKIYRDPFADYAVTDYAPVDLRYFGPFLVTLAAFFTHVMLPAFGISIEPLVVFRFIYFLSHLMGVVIFFYLCKRYLKDWIALGATALFATQPLFYGLSFLNPKDTPLTAFFLASIYTGLLLIDRLEGDDSTGETDKPWYAISKKTWIALLIWGAILFFYMLFREGINGLVAGWIAGLYQADPATLVGKIFGWFARGAGASPVEAYQAKGVRTFTLGLGGLFVIILVLILDARFPGKVLKFLGSWQVWLAGVVVGLSISIRFQALAAGGLIVILYLLKSKRKTLAPMIAYGLVTALTTYFSWPYLWPDPFGRLLESFKRNFGHVHHAPVLYDGEFFAANHLPWHYLPKLILIQFTEPAILLAVAGFFLAFAYWLKHKIREHQYLLLLLWFGVPLVMVVFLPVTVHDNLRHFLFIIPPLFIFAGMTLEWLLERITPRWPKVVLWLVVLLPGIVSIIRLYPYEYIYFNCLTGGLEGAFQRYQMDYMGATFKETMAYLNENAESDATVFVLGPVLVVETYAREDLTLVDRFDHPDREVQDDRTYLVVNNALGPTPERETVYQVIRDGAVLGSVYKYRFDP
jgi:hypothetical protein